MAKRYRYAFAKKREAQQGKLSAVLAAVSLVLFVTAVLLAFFLQGQYGYIVGGISLCAMLLSVYGFAMGLKAFRRKPDLYRSEKNLIPICESPVPNAVRFKPRGFRRHDVARIGNVHQLLHGNRIECQRHLHFAAVHTFLQFTQSADTAHKVDTLVRAQVLDAENLVQNQVGRNRDIQHPNRVVIVVSAGLAVRLYHLPSR